MSKITSSKEPSFKDKTDKLSLIQALNYYSQYHSFEDSKKWALDWLLKNYPDIYETVKNARDYQFSNRGHVCRMIERGYMPSDDLLHKLVEFFNSIDVSPKKTDNAVEVNASKKDDNIFNPIIFNLENVIDAILSEKEIPEVNVPVDKKILKDARTWIDIQEIEFQEQLQKLQSIIDIFTKVSDKIDLIEGKTSRKIVKSIKPQSRNQELRNAAKLVEMVKCPTKLEEFGFTGVSPLRIIGAKSIMVYNKDSRKAMVYHALAGEALSVSRTALKNFDEERSVSKTIRKPENFFAALNNKADPFKLFNNISTRPQQARCRLNEDVIILAVSS